MATGWRRTNMGLTACAEAGVAELILVVAMLKGRNLKSSASAEDGRSLRSPFVVRNEAFSYAPDAIQKLRRTIGSTLIAGYRKKKLKSEEREDEELGTLTSNNRSFCGKHDGYLRSYPTMYKRRTVAPPTSIATKRRDVGRIKPFLDEKATGASMPSQTATKSTPPALNISLRSFKIPLKRKDTTEPKPDKTLTRSSRPAATTKPPEVLENSTKSRPLVPKPSRHRKYDTFDRRARRTPDSTADTTAKPSIPSFVRNSVQIPDVPPTAPNLDDPRVRARLARETAQHDSYAGLQVAPVEIPIHLSADSPNQALQSAHCPSDPFQDQPESTGLGNIPSPEGCPDLTTESITDQSLAPESWSYEVLGLSDFMMDPTLEPSFLSPMTVPETGTTENTEEPQQAVVHCLPLPSFPEPPKIDLEFLLDSSLGTLPMVQKLRWIDHAVKRLDYFCDLYKYRENFQKIISSWN